MNEKELLTYAAKAIDLKWLSYHHSKGLCCRDHKYGGLIEYYWNPLTDDGEALRLAVKLEMEINCMELSQFQVATYDDKGNATYTDDSCVRRAIVRAAAEIGKGMQWKAN